MATLRQLDHTVEVELRPARSDLGKGSTVRVEIASRLRGAELIGDVAAGDRTVEVAIRDKGRERVRRTYLAPRLGDVDLLERAVEESAGRSGRRRSPGDGRPSDRSGATATRGAAERRRSQDHD